MWIPAASLAVEFTFRDRDAGEARLTIRFPFNTPLGTLNSAALLLASRLSAISDAALVRYNFRWKVDNDAPSSPGLQSNVGRYLVLYYSNGIDIDYIAIPSGDESLLETSGDFAGIRLDLGRPEVVLLADAVTEALLPTLGPYAEFWGRWLIVGGIAR